MVSVDGRRIEGLRRLSVGGSRSLSALANESFFRQVRVDISGYGISWSDSTI
jgi:hypothetical protein